MFIFFFLVNSDHRNLHVLTHSFPTRRSSDLFVILESVKERAELTWEDTDFLKTVGRQITSYLALDEAAEQLSQARQFDAYNKLAAFVIHDINNLMSQLSLVTQNRSEERRVGKECVSTGSSRRSPDHKKKKKHTKKQ